MIISENIIRSNHGKYVMEVDITSHSEYGVTQSASIYR